MSAEQHRNEEWTGSFKKPWMNPRMNYQLGGRRVWRFVLTIIAPLLLTIVIVVSLVHAGDLSKVWAEVVIPIAVVAADAAVVVMVLRATGTTPYDQK